MGEMPQYAAKVDGNQQAIVDGLRELGFVVEITHRLPKFVDLVVSGFRRTWSKSTTTAVWTGDVEDEPRALLVEVKMPGERENLTPAEEKLAERWEGHAYLVAENINDILKWYGWI